ncbi:MAG: antibiotic biosynthesis monooxygenase [Prevotellaceae bacterium]|nr:antibiotic biosynthesis monooxygenase [Prevotellaceae bacterium]
MLRLNCFFQAKPGKYNEALEAAILLTAKTQKHEGVIAYDVFESATRKDIFMICETWENEEVLAKHAATPEFAECVGIIERCGEMKIEKLEM